MAEMEKRRVGTRFLEREVTQSDLEKPFLLYLFETKRCSIMWKLFFFDSLFMSHEPWPILWPILFLRVDRLSSAKLKFTIKFRYRWKCLKIIYQKRRNQIKSESKNAKIEIVIVIELPKSYSFELHLLSTHLIVLLCAIASFSSFGWPAS